MKLSVIIVNYKQAGFLPTCLKALAKATAGLDSETVIVENGSCDGSAEYIRTHYPEVRLLVNEENVGFAAGNNRAIAATESDFLLLLNSDTEILDGAVETLLRFLESHPAAGIAVPKLLNTDRSLQHSLYAFPSVWNVFCEMTFLGELLSRSRLLGASTSRNSGYDRERPVEAAAGAAMLIRREVFRRIGLFDEQFFVYTEETDLCYRAKQAGIGVWFVPSAEVVHFWAGRNAATRRSTLWVAGSQMLFFKKHFHGAKRYTLIAFKYTGIILRAFLYAAAGILLLRKPLLRKSSIYFFTAYRLLTQPWVYHHGCTEKVRPWPSV